MQSQFIQSALRVLEIEIALPDVKGFISEDCALHHPGGSLGRKLLLRPRDIMYTVEMLAAEALNLMEKRKVKGLFVTDDNGKPVGVLNMLTLLAAGVV